MFSTFKAASVFSTIALATLSVYAVQTPPWRVIYSNDTTNILNCESPFNSRKGGRVFTEEKLRASVREAAVEGVDAQLLQPGTCWVPWWKSELVPLDQHEQWFKSYYGIEPNVAEHRYLLNGGDMVAAFIDECHKNGKAALVSFRANDSHLQEYAFDKEKIKAGAAHCISRFYVEHPQYRRAALNLNHWSHRNHNWLIPEARAYKEALLAEIIQNYPELDGVEIDFQRHPYYFPDETPMRERVSIMCDFLKKARLELDAVAQKTDGKHRYLGVRVPTWPANHPDGTWEDVGFDPKAWQDAGVDFFNLSTHYCTTQQTGVAQARKLAPDVRIYEELTHTPMTWRMGGTGYDDHQYRRSTKAVLQNTARLSYARGADGVSLFNFAYYRPHGGYLKYKGPFNEPPFAVLTSLADKQSLDRITGYFFLGTREAKFTDKRASASYTMDILPARGNGSATLRLLVITEKERKQSELEPLEKTDRGHWKVALNGKQLASVKNSLGADPFADPQIKSGFNKPEQYLAFKVPAGLLKDGENLVEITAGGLLQPMYLRWIEIIQPVK